jgi:hypothetical protein
MEWVVNMVRAVVPQCLCWSEVPITFSKSDYPNHVPSSGHFPLVVSPIIERTCPSRVLMAGGRRWILYVETLDGPSKAPFYGIILRSIQLPIMFGWPTNFCK